MNITKNLKASDCIIKKSYVYINPSIMNDNPGFLLIHAEWCGYCKRFAPVYEQLNAKLNRNNIKFPCLAIESEELTEKLSKALDFKGFPTLKVVDKDGKILGDYKGDRDMTSLLDTVCKVYHHCV